MQKAQFFIYCSVIFAVSIVPGPSMALAFAEGASRKIGGALPAGLGNMIASLSQAAIALLVFKSVIYLDESLIDSIQLIGAAYIAYIGYNFVRYGGRMSVADGGEGKLKYDPSHRFVRGFLVAFFNPKAIVFFVALFPQFTMAINTGTTTGLIYIFSPIGAIALFCFLIYGFLGHLSFKLADGNYAINYGVPILGILLIALSVVEMIKLLAEYF